ncbi:MAG TPA: SH3 domain-containing protein [Caldilineaceae bacterium]|nr:SH3 domain-containing protein [Caldilineaceae bacterium]
MNPRFRAHLAALGRLRILLAASLIWLAPTIACGSFAPRPTPTPTLPTPVDPAITEAITGAELAQSAPTPLPPPPTDTPVPTTPVTTTTPITPTDQPTVAPTGGAVLAKGQRARVTAPAGLNYRDLPDTDGALLGQFGSGVVVTVLDGPVTADNFTWWQIDDGQGNVGWAAEGDGETQWISPQLGAPQPSNRSPRVGDRVVVSGGQLSVRSQPGVNATLLTRVNSGQEFTVLAGPQQADGFNWYQIRSDDGSIEGWAAEGNGADRWLSPLE